MVGLSGSVGPD